ncbi:MAG: hypothetical protein K2X47_11375, partial [Bdellovibrionales bacterium]|nr:hypothetical protein [Bdellovibrionales bacterium]
FLKENQTATNYDIGTLETNVTLQEGYITSIFMRAPVPNIENPFWCSSFPRAAVKNQELCVISAERAIVAGPVDMQQPGLQEHHPYKNPSIKDPTLIQRGSCSNEALDHAIRAYVSEFSSADLKTLKPVITSAQKTNSMGGRPQIEEYFITVEDARRGQKSVTIKTTFRGHEGKGCLVERL